MQITVKLGFKGHGYSSFMVITSKKLRTLVTLLHKTVITMPWFDGPVEFVLTEFEKY